MRMGFLKGTVLSCRRCACSEDTNQRMFAHSFHASSGLISSTMMQCRRKRKDDGVWHASELDKPIWTKINTYHSIERTRCSSKGRGSTKPSSLATTQLAAIMSESTLMSTKQSARRTTCLYTTMHFCVTSGRRWWRLKQVGENQQGIKPHYPLRRLMCQGNLQKTVSCML